MQEQGTQSEGGLTCDACKRTQTVAFICRFCGQPTAQRRREIDLRERHVAALERLAESVGIGLEHQAAGDAQWFEPRTIDAFYDAMERMTMSCLGEDPHLFRVGSEITIRFGAEKAATCVRCGGKGAIPGMLKGVPFIACPDCKAVQ